MNGTIALLLAQDGLTTGIIYALLSLSILLVFLVTRILWIPAGELVTLGALTMSVLQKQEVPGTIWLLAGLGAATLIREALRSYKTGRWINWWSIATCCVILPVVVVGSTMVLAPMELPMFAQALLTLAIIVPIAPMIYRSAFLDLAGSPALVLLFVAVAVHYMLTGLGLVFFGPDGMRTAPFIPGRLDIGITRISWHLMLVAAVALSLGAGLFMFFERTFWGKSMRAVAFNRKGARLVGIKPETAGTIAFGIAGLIGCLSGILIAPVTGIYYDSGFLIGLRGFVGAVLGGLGSFPPAILGSIFVGLFESYASFFASAYKEAIVFSLLIPILIWRSLVERRRNTLSDDTE
ncbi:MAG: branched-chain amino acid ABC transporter permease [Pseudomonadota bacterium]